MQHRVAPNTRCCHNHVRILTYPIAFTLFSCHRKFHVNRNIPFLFLRQFRQPRSRHTYIAKPSILPCALSCRLTRGRLPIAGSGSSMRPKTEISGKSTASDTDPHARRPTARHILSETYKSLRDRPSWTTLPAVGNPADFSAAPGPTALVRMSRDQPDKRTP